MLMQFPAEELRARRKETFLSIRQMAIVLNVAENTIKRWEATGRISYQNNAKLHKLWHAIENNQSLEKLRKRFGELKLLSIGKTYVVHGRQDPFEFEDGSLLFRSMDERYDKGKLIDFGIGYGPDSMLLRTEIVNYAATFGSTIKNYYVIEDGKLVKRKMHKSAYAY